MFWLPLILCHSFVGLSTPFEFMDAEEPTQNERESLNNANANDLPEDILDEIYEKAIEVSVHFLYVGSHHFPTSSCCCSYRIKNV